MRSLLFALSLLSLTACRTSNGVPAPPAVATTVIRNVNVIPMTGDVALLTNRTVVISEGKIREIGPVGEVKIDKDALVINGTGKYLTPGLAEMHAHIPVPQNGGNDSLVHETLFLYLSRGVTTIRGMLGDPYHLMLKQKVAAGDALGPRIFTSSPSLNGNSVRSPEEARQKVTQYQRDGYDFLKIHPGIQRAVFDELARTADEVGIPFAGHVPVDVGIRRALEARYASVDHLDGYVEGMVPADRRLDPNTGGFFGFNFTEEVDRQKLKELAEATKAAGVWVVPTQTLMTRWLSPTSGEEMAAEPEMQYMTPGTRYAWRQSKQQLQNSDGYSQERFDRYITLRNDLMIALRNAGVGILLGSDAPQVFNVPGFSVLHEMESMAAAGFTPLEILQSGTVNPAIYFKMQGQFGIIAPGAAADLILVEDNPLEDISRMREQAGVMVRGQWLSKEMIDSRLKAIAERYE